MSLIFEVPPSQPGDEFSGEAPVSERVYAAHIERAAGRRADEGKRVDAKARANCIADYFGHRQHHGPPLLKRYRAREPRPEER